MTRDELTREIAKRIKEIRELYYSVYPKGDYLSFFFKKNNILFFNEGWVKGADENYRIEYWEDEAGIKINGIKERK